MERRLVGRERPRQTEADTWQVSKGVVTGREPAVGKIRDQVHGRQCYGAGV